MKKLLAFAIMLLCAVQGWAANPSFQSFDTNDFIAVAPTVKLRHSVDTGTNIFNNFIIINTNTVIVNTETHVTNVFTSIFNSFVTNVTDNSVTIITNSINNITFTTNFIDNSTIVISNTFVIFTNTSVTIDGTNVPTINPTIGRIPYKSGTNSFDDSALYFIDPTTVGANEVDVNTVGVTNLVTGGFVISVDSGSGYGTLTNAPFSAFSNWTNSGGLLQPVDLTLPIFWTNQLVLGPGSTNVLYRNGGNLIYTNGSTTLNGVNFQVLNGNGVRAMFGVDQDEQPFVRSDAGKLFRVEPDNGSPTYSFSGSAFYPSTLANIGSDTSPWGTNLYLAGFSNSTNYSRLSVSHTGTNGAVVFDSQSDGTALHVVPYNFNLNGTNSLIISSNLLTYTGVSTNSSAIVLVKQPSGGKQVTIAANSTAGSFTTTSPQAQINTPATSMQILSNVVYVTTTAPYVDLQSSSTTFRDGWFSGSLYAVGLISAFGTNYSRLSISQTGTNAWDRIMFDSQSAGIAGTNGRPFAFTNAPMVLPGFTKAQKATLATQEGMILYQTDNTPGIRVYQSGAWVMVSTVADP